MKKLPVILLAAAMMLPVMGGCGQPDPSEPENSVYTNPVYEPVFADPCVIEYEGKYYAYATEDYGEWKPSDDPLENVSNKKVVPILESEDLVHWYFKNAAFTELKKPSWGSYGAGVWAPDVVQIGDTFVMYYALSVWGDEDPGIGIATASHPLGPWTDQGKLFTSREIGVNNSIDPAVFRDQDGNYYMIWGSFRGLYGVRLTDDGLALQGGIEAAKNDKVLVAGLDTSTPWNGGTYEAPYIIYQDGYYYMFVSSGTCCEGLNSTYHVRVGRSKNPLGPYVGSDGRDMLGTSRGDVVVQAGEDFVGVGHNAVIRDANGDWYILYHGFDTKEYGMYGNSNRRTLLLDKLVWENGFPYVEGKVAGRNDLTRPAIGK
ncbi:MAG: family 43 glycosylhydrolase [Clostridia bacterium]|nr:family 43 glycosylhydrolase [Clostridia bacterium]